MRWQDLLPHAKLYLTQWLIGDDVGVMFMFVSLNIFGEMNGSLNEMKRGNANDFDSTYSVGARAAMDEAIHVGISGISIDVSRANTHTRNDIVCGAT